MSSKGSFLILKRFRAGDEDLMLKVYGPCGMVKAFIHRGYIAERGFLGYAEPFNLIKVIYRQSGDIVFFKDILEVSFYSYLCLEDYKRYLWMSSVALFVERWFLQYEPELFNMALYYLTLNPSNHDVFLLKFKLEFLKRLGLYKEDLFEEKLRNLVKKLVDEEFSEKLERFRISPALILELEKSIEAHLSSSL